MTGAGRGQWVDPWTIPRGRQGIREGWEGGPRGSSRVMGLALLGSE